MEIFTSTETTVICKYSNARFTNYYFFLTQKGFISVNLFMVSYKQEMRKYRTYKSKVFQNYNFMFKIPIRISLNISDITDKQILGSVKQHKNLITII